MRVSQVVTRQVDKCMVDRLDKLRLCCYVTGMICWGGCMDDVHLANRSERRERDTVGIRNIGS